MSGAHERKKIAFFMKLIFLIFVFYVNVYWINFQNMYIFTYQQTL